MNAIRNHSATNLNYIKLKMNDYTKLFPTHGNLVCRYYIKNVFIG